MSPTVKPQRLGGYCISPLVLQRRPACRFLVYLIVVPIVLSQFLQVTFRMISHID